MAENNKSDDDKDDKDKPDVDVEDTEDTDDAEDTGKPADKPDLGDAGKKAIDAMKRERNAAKKALADAQAKLKEYADKDKTDTERLAEAAEEAKNRAAKAEQSFGKLQTAMDRAPEGATLAQIKAVAKRLTGDTEEEMEADADELFALLAPPSTEDTERGKAPAGRPKERLRGGGDPEDEPEEMDPRKLAALIGRP